jgi:hypothetical protein
MLRTEHRGWELLVVADNGGNDRHALSMALPVADEMGMPRSAIYRHGCEDESCDSKPPNEYVYRTAKEGRYAIVA